MARFPRTVTFEEAFRKILRAIHPERPALADEVESFWWHDRKRLPDEDVAVNKARELFEERVAQGKFRLRGVLDPRKPREDIDPADAKVGKPDIFAGELRVFHNNKVVRTYRQVDIYETDVRRCVAELRSEIKPAKWTNEPGFERFTTAYKNSLNGKAPPTEAEFTAAANGAGHYRPRKEMRAAWRNAFGPLPPGPRPKSQEK
jgi:hypothetical protein